MSLEVLAFVPHPIASASGRYRVYQMAGPLAKHGVDLDVRPFLDERGFAGLYAPGALVSKTLDLARGGVRRWADLGASRYRLALVHRELWPVVGDPPLRRFSKHQPRWVFDFDDAIWIPNVSDANRAFARLKPFGQPAWLAAGAHGVAAGNGYLAQWAREQRPGRPGEEVELIPTAVDTDHWTPVRHPEGPPRLVWIGSHSTLAHLEELRAPLARLAARHPGLEIHVIGASLPPLGLPVVNHEWSEGGEVDLVRRCDIGLAPLPDTDWARGKCGLKLLLSMACGLASVASRTGVNPEIVRDGENGLLAGTPEEFEGALDRLIGDPPLRGQLGESARATVEERFSVRVVAPRLAAMLQRAAETN